MSVRLYVITCVTTPPMIDIIYYLGQKRLIYGVIIDKNIMRLYVYIHTYVHMLPFLCVGCDINLCVCVCMYVGV